MATAGLPKDHNETTDLAGLVKMVINTGHQESQASLQEDSDCKAVPWTNPVAQESPDEGSWHIEQIDHTERRG